MGCHSRCENCKYYLECKNKGKSLFDPCRLKDESTRPPHISILRRVAEDNEKIK